MDRRALVLGGGGVTGIGWGFIGRLLWDTNTSLDPKRARAWIGQWALATPTMLEADRRKVFQARLHATPDRRRPSR